MVVCFKFTKPSLNSDRRASPWAMPMKFKSETLLSGPFLPPKSKMSNLVSKGELALTRCLLPASGDSSQRNYRFKLRRAGGSSPSAPFSTPLLPSGLAAEVPNPSLPSYSVWLVSNAPLELVPPAFPQQRPRTSYSNSSDSPASLGPLLLNDLVPCTTPASPPPHERESKRGRLSASWALYEKGAVVGKLRAFVTLPRRLRLSEASIEVDEL